MSGPAVRQLEYLHGVERGVEVDALRRQEGRQRRLHQGLTLVHFSAQLFSPFWSVSRFVHTL